MKETAVLIVSSIGLIVLGYGVRLFQEAAREWVGKKSSRDDYIDWAKVPKWYVYGTVGGIYGGLQFWKDKPIMLENRWTSDIEVFMDAYELGCPDAIIGPLPPWRESLRKRPGSEK